MAKGKPKSHPRQWVDGSDPFYIALVIPPKAPERIDLLVCRKDLNHPPTTVGGFKCWIDGQGIESSFYKV